MWKGIMIAEMALVMANLWLFSTSVKGVKPNQYLWPLDKIDNCRKVYGYSLPSNITLPDGTVRSSAATVTSGLTQASSALYIDRAGWVELEGHPKTCITTPDNCTSEGVTFSIWVNFPISFPESEPAVFFSSGGSVQAGNFGFSLYFNRAFVFAAMRKSNGSSLQMGGHHNAGLPRNQWINFALVYELKPTEKLLLYWNGTKLIETDTFGQLGDATLRRTSPLSGLWIGRDEGYPTLQTAGFKVCNFRIVMKSLNATELKTGVLDVDTRTGVLSSEVIKPDIDECSLKCHQCPKHSSCQNTKGDYNCSCNVGYTGNGKLAVCQDVNECMMGTHGCHPNATCINTAGSYQCTCKRGFTGIGTHCQDIDECSLKCHQCLKHSSCQNTNGDYNCSCNVGYTGNGKLAVCQDVNECMMGTHGCHPNATCINTAGSYQCTCKRGFAGSGTHCQDVQTSILPVVSPSSPSSSMADSSQMDHTYSISSLTTSTQEASTSFSNKMTSVPVPTIIHSGSTNDVQTSILPVVSPSSPNSSMAGSSQMEITSNVIATDLVQTFSSPKMNHTYSIRTHTTSTQAASTSFSNKMTSVPVPTIIHSSSSNDVQTSILPIVSPSSSSSSMAGSSQMEITSNVIATDLVQTSSSPKMSHTYSTRTLTTSIQAANTSSSNTMTDVPVPTIIHSSSTNDVQTSILPVVSPSGPSSSMAGSSQMEITYNAKATDLAQTSSSLKMNHTYSISTRTTSIQEASTSSYNKMTSVPVPTIIHSSSTNDVQISISSSTVVTETIQPTLTIEVISASTASVGPQDLNSSSVLLQPSPSASSNATYIPSLTEMLKSNNKTTSIQQDMKSSSYSIGLKTSANTTTLPTSQQLSQLSVDPSSTVTIVAENIQTTLTIEVISASTASVGPQDLNSSSVLLQPSPSASSNATYIPSLTEMLKTNNKTTSIQQDMKSSSYYIGLKTSANTTTLPTSQQSSQLSVDPSSTVTIVAENIQTTLTIEVISASTASVGSQDLNSSSVLLQPSPSASSNATYIPSLTVMLKSNNNTTSIQQDMKSSSYSIGLKTSANTTTLPTSQQSYQLSVDPSSTVTIVAENIQTTLTIEVISASTASVGPQDLNSSSVLLQPSPSGSSNATYIPSLTEMVKSNNKTTSIQQDMKSSSYSIGLKTSANTTTLPTSQQSSQLLINSSSTVTVVTENIQPTSTTEVVSATASVGPQGLSSSSVLLQPSPSASSNATYIPSLTEMLETNNKTTSIQQDVKSPSYSIVLKASANTTTLPTSQQLSQLSIDPSRTVKVGTENIQPTLTTEVISASTASVGPQDLSSSSVLLQPSPSASSIATYIPSLTEILETNNKTTSIQQVLSPGIHVTSTARLTKVIQGVNSTSRDLRIPSITLLSTSGFPQTQSIPIGTIKYSSTIATSIKNRSTSAFLAVANTSRVTIAETPNISTTAILGEMTSQMIYRNDSTIAVSTPKTTLKLVISKSSAISQTGQNLTVSYGVEPMISSSSLYSQTGIHVQVTPIGTIISLSLSASGTPALSSKSSLTTTTLQPSATPLFVESTRAEVKSETTASLSKATRMSTLANPSPSSSVKASFSEVSLTTTSFNPAKTDNLVVASYATPCYIYFVVEQTMGPMATVNSTSPQETQIPIVTLDIGNISTIPSTLTAISVTIKAGTTVGISQAKSSPEAETSVQQQSSYFLKGSSVAGVFATLSDYSKVAATPSISVSPTSDAIVISVSKNVSQSRMETSSSKDFNLSITKTTVLLGMPSSMVSTGTSSGAVLSSEESAVMKPSQAITQIVSKTVNGTFMTITETATAKPSINGITTSTVGQPINTVNATVGLASKVDEGKTVNISVYSTTIVMVPATSLLNGTSQSVSVFESHSVNESRVSSQLQETSASTTVPLVYTTTANGTMVSAGATYSVSSATGFSLGVSPTSLAQNSTVFLKVNTTIINQFTETTSSVQSRTPTPSLLDFSTTEKLSTAMPEVLRTSTAGINSASFGTSMVSVNGTFLSNETQSASYGLAGTASLIQTKSVLADSASHGLSGTASLLQTTSNGLAGTASLVQTTSVLDDSASHGLTETASLLQTTSNGLAGTASLVQTTSVLADSASHGLSGTASLLQTTSNGLAGTASLVQTTSVLADSASHGLSETASLLQTTSNGLAGTASLVQTTSVLADSASHGLSETASLLQTTSNGLAGTASLVQTTSVLADSASHGLSGTASLIQTTSNGLAGTASLVQTTSVLADSTSYGLAATASLIQTTSTLVDNASDATVTSYILSSSPIPLPSTVNVTSTLTVHINSTVNPPSRSGRKRRDTVPDNSTSTNISAAYTTSIGKSKTTTSTNTVLPSATTLIVSSQSIPALNISTTITTSTSTVLDDSHRSNTTGTVLFGSTTRALEASIPSPSQSITMSSVLPSATTLIGSSQSIPALNISTTTATSTSTVLDDSHRSNTTGTVLFGSTTRALEASIPSPSQSITMSSVLPSATTLIVSSQSIPALNISTTITASTSTVLDDSIRSNTTGTVLFGSTTRALEASIPSPSQSITMSPVLPSATTLMLSSQSIPALNISTTITTSTSTVLDDSHRSNTTGTVLFGSTTRALEASIPSPSQSITMSSVLPSATTLMLSSQSIPALHISTTITTSTSTVLDDSHRSNTTGTVLFGSTTRALEASIPSPSQSITMSLVLPSATTLMLSSQSIPALNISTTTTTSTSTVLDDSHRSNTTGTVLFGSTTRALEASIPSPSQSITMSSVLPSATTLIGSAQSIPALNISTKTTTSTSTVSVQYISSKVVSSVGINILPSQTPSLVTNYSISKSTVPSSSMFAVEHSRSLLESITSVQTLSQQLISSKPEQTSSMQTHSQTLNGSTTFVVPVIIPTVTASQVDGSILNSTQSVVSHPSGTSTVEILVSKAVSSQSSSSLITSTMASTGALKSTTKTLETTSVKLTASVTSREKQMLNSTSTVILGASTMLKVSSVQDVGGSIKTSSTREILSSSLMTPVSHFATPISMTMPTASLVITTKELKMNTTQVVDERSDSLVFRVSDTSLTATPTLAAVSSVKAVGISSTTVAMNYTPVVQQSGSSYSAFRGITSTLVMSTPELTSVSQPNIMSTIPADFSSSRLKPASSSLRKNPLVTISSLGICYVVYTTRIVQPTLVPSPISTLPPAVNTSVVQVATTPIRESTSYLLSALSTLSTKVALNSTVFQAAIVTSFLSSTVPPIQRTLAVNSTIFVGQPTVSPRFNSTAAILGQTTVAVGLNSTSVTTMESIFRSATGGLDNSTIYLVPTPSSALVLSRSEYIGTTAAVVTSQLSSLLVAGSATPATGVETSVIISASSSFPFVIPTSVAMSTALPPTTAPTTTVPPTTVPSTTLPPNDTVLIAVLSIPLNVDVNSTELKANISAGLEQGYNLAVRRRRKRATDGTEAIITDIARQNPQNENVDVAFYIKKNGDIVKATNAAAVYQQFSASLLSRKVGYTVIKRPTPLGLPTPSPPPQSNLVSMIFEKAASNLSIPANKLALEKRLAAYYKEKKTLTSTVTATIYKVVLEVSKNVYVEFYITVNGQLQPGADVVKGFHVEDLVMLTARLEEPVAVAPYTSSSLSESKNDYVISRMSGPYFTPSSNLQDPTFTATLEDKLAAVYKEGKSTSARRKRRALGSISAKIINITLVQGSPGQADVTFVIIDSGKVANATYVSATFNKLSKNQMTLITKPFAIIKRPVPDYVPPMTEKPPEPVPDPAVRYWIIGAVLGPLALILVIILLLCWKCRCGPPPGKVQPETGKEQQGRLKMQPSHGFDVARYAEGKPAIKTSNLVEPSDYHHEKPAGRETSLRRKVAKSKTPHGKRTNPAYEESEEDEEESRTTGSRERIIRAQPGPGMKAKKEAKPLARTTPSRPPLNVIEDDEETESELSETQSETESVATTRTDQTKYSAAQVPAVAVMGGASGPPRYPPVRFRSSVYPVSSLPPIGNKQTSLVGVKVEPPSEDQDEDERAPRKDKRRSKATQRELKQKADIERFRNKQRQRERKNQVYPSQAGDKRAWARTQHRLNDVLDPRADDPFSRGKRRKPRKSKKGADVATDEEGIELQSYKPIRNDRRQEEEDNRESGESSDESAIGMEETRWRMHSLLEDAFSLLEPLKKNHQSDIPRGHPMDPRTGSLVRPPAPPRYAGSRPALPEPAPAHGRATEPTPRQRRRLLDTGSFPQSLPRTPIGPGYPIRPHVRPPQLTSDPVVVWDPYERQRYINQRMGYPANAGQPTYSYTDPHGQSVYITPVQQQRDDLGGMIWSPYGAEDTMADFYPDLAKSNYPGALGASPPKPDTYLDARRQSRDTIIDMNSSDPSGHKGYGIGQSPQPLIRSIKDELMRLSHGGARKTPITEL